MFIFKNEDISGMLLEPQLTNASLKARPYSKYFSSKVFQNCFKIFQVSKLFRNCSELFRNYLKIVSNLFQNIIEAAFIATAIYYF